MKLKFIDYIPVSSNKKSNQELNKDELLWHLLIDNTRKTSTKSNQDSEQKVSTPSQNTETSKQETPKVDRSVYVPTETLNEDKPESSIVTPKIEHAAQQLAVSSDNDGVKINPRTGEIRIGENVVVSNQVNAIIDELIKTGFRGEITRGLEPGAKTAQGRNSFHGVHDYHAIDIAPFADMTWDQFRNHIILTGADKIFKKYGYGILDETAPEMMSKTNASGPHLHIGRDKIATGKLGGKLYNPYK